MTDKEKIIIDGVDVSECKYHEIGTCFDEYGDEVEYDYCLFNDDSCNNLLKQNECVYLLKRQLQRKEQECEKYEQTLDEIENYINSQGIDNKWNMYIQRFRSGILNIINKAKDGNNEQL